MDPMKKTTGEQEPPEDRIDSKWRMIEEIA
jgi:hypothetical protein